MASYEIGHKLPHLMAQVALYIAYYVNGQELPDAVYSLMGITPEDLKRECSDFVDPIVNFCTTPKELSLHHIYTRIGVDPRLSKVQLEQLKNLKKF